MSRAHPSSLLSTVLLKLIFSTLFIKTEIYFILDKKKVILSPRITCSELTEKYEGNDIPKIHRLMQNRNMRVLPLKMRLPLFGVLLLRFMSGLI